MKSYKRISIGIIIIFSLAGISAANGQTKSGVETGIDLENFLKAETAEARNLLSGYSFETLENFTNQYMSSSKMQNIEESRKLWLVEEYYKRKADKTASDRLFYVFLAVSLLMLLIFILTFRIFQMQKNLQKLE